MYSKKIEFIDMHFGTGPSSADSLTDVDPYILNEHLREIDLCAEVSKSAFFIVSIWMCNGKFRKPNIDRKLEASSYIDNNN